MKINSFMKDGIPTISPKDVLVFQDAKLIDVRMPEEYVGELGHIEGTMLITLGPELENFLKSANKEAHIIFICRSGARSARASAAALELGFKNIYNMEGGMIEWNKMELPTVS
jgi:hydroxyacylglutathione hydrolase